MGSYIGTFKRKEVKYRLSARKLDEFMEAIKGHITHDEFGLTHISSFYFDDAEHSIIARSLEKPLYKEKLRLRAYGTPSDSDRVFLELKKKFKGIVYKRRVGVSYTAAKAFLNGMPYEQAVKANPLPKAKWQGEALSARGLQIAREIDVFVQRNAPLHAAMLIESDREAFVEIPQDDASVIDRQLRITFDHDIAFTQMQPSGSTAPNRRMQDSRRTSQPNKLLAAGECVMEIKVVGSYPLWLVRALDQCQIYPTSFSKYGESYKICAGQTSRQRA